LLLLLQNYLILDGGEPQAYFFTALQLKIWLLLLGSENLICWTNLYSHAVSDFA